MAESFEISFPSCTVKGQEVQERIIALLVSLGYADRDVFGVRLALEEALVNAIKHGNKMDQTKSVHVKCTADEQMVHVEIRDEGEGFIVENVPDCTLEENLERPSGRGIMLMKAFMNHVEYNDVGNQITIEKINGIDPPRQ